MSTIPSRLDYLDATRAFALMLGVVFHASLSFLPVFIGWAVQDVSTSDWIGLAITVSHSFRMELFFLLAGFFTHMTLQRRGLLDLVRSRLMRIVVPFVVGWFVLHPLITAGWMMGGASMRGDYEFWGSILAEFKQLKLTGPSLFVGTHLWFLYYLILITTSTLAARALLKSIAIKAPKLTSRIDDTIAWLSRSIWALPLTIGPIALTLGFMDAWGMDTPDKSLIPHIPVLLIYGGFFALGWLLERQPDALNEFSKITPSRILILLLGTVGVFSLISIQSDLGHPDQQSARHLYHIGYAAMMWTLVWITIGIFRKTFNRPSATVRYVADSSYWMYLIHLPIVVWLQVAVAEWEIHWAFKLAGVSIATIGIALITYDLFVRSTIIGQVLNGRRRPRAIFATRGN